MKRRACAGADQVCVVREVRQLLWLAPAIALCAAIAGFVLAHALDTPPAHTTVALLCAALPIAWGVRRLRDR